MKKWLYLAALLATCYLNLVYDWPEGRTILVVELVFPAVLYLEAKLMSVRIKIRPQGDLQMAEEGETLHIPFVVENCGAFRIPVLWLWMGKNRKVVRDLKKGGRQTLIFPYHATVCGKQVWEIKKAVTRDASGMFYIRIRRFVSEPVEIHVVPKTYPVFAEISKAVRLFVTEGRSMQKTGEGTMHRRYLTSMSTSPGTESHRSTGN